MVHVRLFASLREAAGQAEIELPWDNVSAAKGVFEELIRRFPALERMRPVTLVAVNEVYGNWETPVAPGDRIAFFPPVSGGSR
ncbi:MAG: MoaD/ThiS family protein [Acidobacteria bacterium]|nr:MAG: MoaD/ThiS family protein [Acidobacteriota bacterium]RPJ83410.1 MAG: MoaD/ThiS family protein [Acidobacteriota bacterium]